VAGKPQQRFFLSTGKPGLAFAKAPACAGKALEIKRCDRFSAAALRPKA
jgi:hypothetical protein